MTKQIRLNGRVIVIYNCEECPIDKCKYICDKCCAKIPYDDNGVCVACPLEDAE